MNVVMFMTYGDVYVRKLLYNYKVFFWGKYVNKSTKNGHLDHAIELSRNEHAQINF